MSNLSQHDQPAPYLPAPYLPAPWPPGLQLAAFGLCIAQAAFIITAFAIGQWLLDENGQRIANDFVGQWAAGKLVLDGQGVVYDWDLQKAATVAALGRDYEGGFPQFYPPHYFLFVPLMALAPYTLSHVLWVALTPIPYIYVVTRIIEDRLAILLALAFPAMLANAMIGQNGCITAALVGGALVALDRDRPILAGILIGLLTYKPHFGILFPLALICAQQWRAFASAAVVTVLLVVVSALILGTSAWFEFFDTLLSVNRSIFGMGTADYSKLQSIFGLVRASGGSLTLAWICHGTAAAIIVAWVCVAWLSRAPFAMKAAIFSVGAVICSPYAYMYDLMLLAVPAAYLLRDGRDRGFLPYEMAGLAVACLLLLSFPLFKASVGVAATWIIAGVIARRWFLAEHVATAGNKPPAVA
jgi:arabinofuranan 3-O-arabinosyltransferase